MAGAQPTYTLQFRLDELEKRVEALEGKGHKPVYEPAPEIEESEGDAKKKKK